MSPQTKKLLRKFAQAANWSTPGSAMDMELFWDFVICAYKEREHDISLDEFLEVLNENSKSKKEISDLMTKKRDLAGKIFMFSKYEDGIKLLKKFDQK